jgi:hypothetical protein
MRSVIWNTAREERARRPAAGNDGPALAADSPSGTDENRFHKYHESARLPAWPVVRAFLDPLVHADWLATKDAKAAA